MTDIATDRLILHPIDTDEAERIVDQEPGADDHWADDFPFEGDIVAVSMFLQATAHTGEQRPYGYYRITRATDGLAIGGIGFKGGPADGCVEVGYGLAESARGHGYAVEALTALVRFAADRGVERVIADTLEDNIASQRTLERAGFTRIEDNADYWVYEIRLRNADAGQEARSADGTRPSTPHPPTGTQPG